MNKQEALARLAQVETETAALRKIIEAPEVLPGLWRPEKGSTCWNVSQQGRPIGDTNHSLGFIAERVEFGNCFPSREIAEKAAPLMARANKIIAAALQVDPEASNLPSYGKLRWGVYFNTSSKRWEIVSNDSYDQCVVYVSTLAFGAEMARILNAEGVK